RPAASGPMRAVPAPATSGIACGAERADYPVRDAMPFLRQVVETCAAFGRHRIVDARAAVYDPALGFEGAALLQTVEGGIDHALAEGNGFAGGGLDRLDEFVAIH